MVLILPVRSGKCWMTRGKVGAMDNCRDVFEVSQPPVILPESKRDLLDFDQDFSDNFYLYRFTVI